ncbi:MAG: hypothetical protein Q4C75_01440, partial [Bergeyella zoohelcum]|nr:hypothetical protein [Bergeyella zoohelcum]
MKKLFTILGIVTLSIRVFGQADTDNVNIPDTNFKKKLVENTVINTNGDAEISYGEAKEYKEALDVSFSNISDITGIEAFINITSLNLNNNQLKSLDLSKNIELVDLWCSNNQLTSLNLGGNFVLSRVYCSNNQLTSLDLSENKVLT